MVDGGRTDLSARVELGGEAGAGVEFVLGVDEGILVILNCVD